MCHCRPKLAICPSTRSFFDLQKWVFRNGTDRQTDRRTSQLYDWIGLGAESVIMPKNRTLTYRNTEHTTVSTGLWTYDIQISFRCFPKRSVRASIAGAVMSWENPVTFFSRRLSPRLKAGGLYFLVIQVILDHNTHCNHHHHPHHQRRCSKPHHPYHH